MSVAKSECVYSSIEFFLYITNHNNSLLKVLYVVKPPQ